MADEPVPAVPPDPPSPFELPSAILLTPQKSAPIAGAPVAVEPKGPRRRLSGLALAGLFFGILGYLPFLGLAFYSIFHVFTR